jgi:hypothetical protein
LHTLFAYQKIEIKIFSSNLFLIVSHLIKLSIFCLDTVFLLCTVWLQSWVKHNVTNRKVSQVFKKFFEIILNMKLKFCIFHTLAVFVSYRGHQLWKFTKIPFLVQIQLGLVLIRKQNSCVGKILKFLNRESFGKFIRMRKKLF